MLDPVRPRESLDASLPNTTSEPTPGRAGWADEHRTLYLHSGGNAGHIMDLGAVGGHALTTHCLLRHLGRRSGRTLITALIYGTYCGDAVIVASNGGADRHPEWYRNIQANGSIDFQIATQAFRGSWREPEGSERERLWNFMVDVFPPYADYQAATMRRIPLITMSAAEQIPVFTDNNPE